MGIEENVPAVGHLHAARADVVRCAALLTHRLHLRSHDSNGDTADGHAHQHTDENGLTVILLRRLRFRNIEVLLRFILHRHIGFIDFRSQLGEFEKCRIVGAVFDERHDLFGWLPHPHRKCGCSIRHW